MIKYYRWIPTLDVENNRNVFKDVIDHEDNENELNKARALVNNWLSCHYGYCIINIINGINSLEIKLDNKQKMKKELKSLGIFVKIKSK